MNPESHSEPLPPPTSSATRFTFMSDDGRYPTAPNGKVQWVSDREGAIRKAKSWDCNILVEMDEQGHLLGMVNLKSPNAPGERPPAQTL